MSSGHHSFAFGASVCRIHRDIEMCDCWWTGTGEVAGTGVGEAVLYGPRQRGTAPMKIYHVSVWKVKGLSGNMGTSVYHQYMPPKSRHKGSLDVLGGLSIHKLKAIWIAFGQDTGNNMLCLCMAFMWSGDGPHGERAPAAVGEAPVLLLLVHLLHPHPAVPLPLGPRPLPTQQHPRQRQWHPRQRQ